MRIKQLVVFLFLGFYLTTSAYAAIIINEFSIEPEQKVELWNTGTETIDISNWIIDDSGGSTYFTIPSGTSLVPENCLVFAHDFNFNKTTADTVRLLDLSFHLLDSRAYDKSPGNFSWYRLPDGSENWLSGTSSFGLKNETSTNCLSPAPTVILPSEVLPSLTEVISQPTTSLPTYDQIYLSEIMVNPESGNEWVEIYNSQESTVTLENWYLDDGENEGASPKLFSLTLNPKNWGIVELNNALYNNSGDTVRLLTPEKNEVERFEYSDSEKGFSFSRQTYSKDGQWCQTEQTKSAINKSCYQLSASPTLSPLSPTLVLISLKPETTNKVSPPNLQITLGTHYYPLPKQIGKVLGSVTQSTRINQSFVRYYYLTLFLLCCNFICHFSLFLYILYLHYGQKNIGKIFLLD